MSAVELLRSRHTHAFQAASWINAKLAVLFHKAQAVWRRRRLRSGQKHIRRRFSDAQPGERDWLIGAEIKYGGMVMHVPRNKISSMDPRTDAQVTLGGMTGGDRMLYLNYGVKYAQYLRPLVREERSVTLAEFGILMGTGLAIWCDLFPQSRVLGLDIDLGHIRGNMANLKQLGAFEKNQPELYEYDQFLDNTQYLETILKGDRIDVCIDDGFHSVESIMTTMQCVVPHLADRFIYIIEDNVTVHRDIRAAYPQFTMDHKGPLTVVSNG